MGMFKSVQYSMFCENYFIQGSPELSCNSFEDYADIGTKPVEHFKKLGYKKIKGRWYCSKCTANGNHTGQEPIKTSETFIPDDKISGFIKFTQ